MRWPFIYNFIWLLYLGRVWLTPPSAIDLGALGLIGLGIMASDLFNVFQIASLGEMPPSLRFIYAKLTSNVYRFRACYADDASEDEMECASSISTEIIGSIGNIVEIEIQEIIKKSSGRPWKVNKGKGLMYLRYGELEGCPKPLSRHQL